MGFDSFFKKGWDFTKKIDPITPRLLEFGSKYASKGVGEIAHGIGWKALEREADKNYQNPERGIGRAAAATALAYGGGALLGAGGGGSAGAAASAAPEGAILDAGIGEAGTMGASPYAGSVLDSGMGEAGTMSGGSNLNNWMRLGKSMMGGQGGGQSGQSNALLRQMRMAEVMRQSAAYSAAHQREAENDQ